MTAGEVAAGALLGWSSCVAAVSGVALWRALAKHERAPAATSHGATRVLLVRPCAGREAHLAHTLATTREVCDGVNVRVRFAVATEDDAATPVARGVARALRARGIDAEVVITGGSSFNHKVAHLARCVERDGRDCDVVVNVDSDVDLTGASLAAGLARLEGDPKLGAVWWPPVEARGTTTADRASEAFLAGSLHAFALLSGIDRGGLVGKMVALRREALDGIGGFGALERHLGEDMELARRLLAAAWRVEAMPAVAVSRASGRPWRAVIDRYARWITVIRAQRPALTLSYPLLFFATPLVVALSLWGAALTGGRARAWCFTALALALGSRLLVALVARRLSGRHVSFEQALGDVALADAVVALAFVDAMSAREVVWRGRRLSIGGDGVLRDAR